MSGGSCVGGADEKPTACPCLSLGFVDQQDVCLIGSLRGSHALSTFTNLRKIASSMGTVTVISLNCPQSQTVPVPGPENILQPLPGNGPEISQKVGVGEQRTEQGLPCFRRLRRTHFSSAHGGPPARALSSKSPPT